MALDEAIAIAVRTRQAPPTLRLYSWIAPSVSLGVFQPIGEIDAAYCAGQAIPVVRRPTGGRAILHGDELTYSFSAPADCSLFGTHLRDAYRALSSAFAFAFRHIGLPAVVQNRPVAGRLLTRSALCFQSVSLGELTVSGKKIIGSAQKRWPDGFLQQGSIPFSIDAGRSAGIFMKRTTDNEDCTGLKSFLGDFDENALQRAVIAAFEKTFTIRLVEAVPSRQEAELAARLTEEKYRSRTWTEALSRRRQSGCNIGTPLKT